VLLTVLLTVINGVNFTMVAQDADRITQRLADQYGQFIMDGGQKEHKKKKDFEDSTNQNAATGVQGEGQEIGRFGPMGPDSPEMRASVRYFTFAFSEDGEKVETVAFNMSAITEEEAESWAKDLLDETVGWTKGIYRYRVYTNPSGDLTYVTVIDQGREMLPSYRILIISIVGEVLCIIISIFVLKLAGKAVFSPLEEADRKQKKFIAGVNNEFGLPLTIINANAEILERTYGPDEQTNSIRRQVKKMGQLVEKINSSVIFDDNSKAESINLSELVLSGLNDKAAGFESKGIRLTKDIEDGVMINADKGKLMKLIDELINNSMEYAKKEVSFILRRKEERIVLQCENDTELEDNEYNQVFDRFTKLDNAKDNDHAGLGLSYVKETAGLYDGRVSAMAKDGRFVIKIAL
ncbi:MAG: HAMP domain-containing histidine kinase, partial [Lachnospiraceae bacterium]|nr:HAMP domain-containing histidine kinase [Lachnospiraceae bacterium]